MKCKGLLWIPFSLFLMVTSLESILCQNGSESFHRLYQQCVDFLDSGEIDSAYHYGLHALEYADSTHHRMDVLFDLGYISLLMDSPIQGEEHFQSLLDGLIAQSNGDDETISQCYYYLGLCRSNMEDHNEALVYYQHSLKYIDQDSFPIDYAYTLSAIATIYTNKSDYDNAILYEQQAMNLFDLTKEYDSSAYSSNGLSLLYYSKHQFEQAAYHAQKALAYYQQNASGDNARERVYLFNNLCLIAIKKNAYNKAQGYIDQAIKIESDNGLQGTRGTTQFNLGFLQYSKGEWREAQQSFDRAIEIIEITHPSGNTEIAKAYYYLGKIGEHLAQEGLALLNYQKSIRVLVPAFKKKDLISNPSLQAYCRSDRNLLRALIAKASVLANAEYFMQARNQIDTVVLKSFDVALDVSQKLRKTYRSEDSKYFLAEETKTLFSNVIDYCYRQYKNTGQDSFAAKAFEYVEKSRAPILMENYARTSITTYGGVPDSLLQLERNLSLDFAFLRKQHFEAQTSSDSQRVSDLTNKVLVCQRKMESLQSEFEQNYPQYYGDQYGRSYASIKDVQQEISSGEVFLQYFYSGTDIYLIGVEVDRIGFIRIEEGELIKSRANQFKQLVSEPRRDGMSSESLYSTMMQSAHYLYQKLLHPVLSKDAGQVRNLIISSNGFLTNLPFVALIRKPVDVSSLNYLSPNYLVKDYIISYQPSASLMLATRKKKTSYRQDKVLAFAPFASEARNDDQSLSPLPYSKQEVEGIEVFFDTDTFADEAATKQNFLMQAADYRMIHLATHGSTDLEYADRAQLSFYPGNEPDSTTHVLHSYEIQNLRLNAEMVTLSACETGIGRLDRGEGMLSLARSFFYTGVESVLMTNWQVNDRATEHIVNKLYAGLKDGTEKDVALFKAQNHFLKHEADMATAHPYYWAGINVLGDMGKLDHSAHGFDWPVILLVAIVLLFVCKKWLL